MKTKKCSKCGKRYSATKEYFRSNRSLKDGLAIWCKKCCKKYDAQYRRGFSDELREEMRKYNKNYCLVHKKKLNAQGLEYYFKNKSRMREANKEWRRHNRKRFQKYRIEYYKNNRERVLEKSKKYAFDCKNRLDSEIIIPKNKRCFKCGKIKSWKKFNKGRCNKDGLSGRCKACNIKYLRRYYLMNIHTLIKSI